VSRKAQPAARGASCGPKAIDELPVSNIVAPPIIPTASATQVIRAEIVGIDCASAEGITASGSAPVLKLCRLLVEAGLAAASPLDAFRGPVLCLRIRSIGEAATLSVDESRSAFCRWKPFSRAAVSPPMRQNGRGAL